MSGSLVFRAIKTRIPWETVRKDTSKAKERKLKKIPAADPAPGNCGVLSSDNDSTDNEEDSDTDDTTDSEEDSEDSGTDDDEDSDWDYLPQPDATSSMKDLNLYVQTNGYDIKLAGRGRTKAVVLQDILALEAEDDADDEEEEEDDEEEEAVDSGGG